jgi:hypothetical protein
MDIGKSAYYWLLVNAIDLNSPHGYKPGYLYINKDGIIFLS